MLSIFNNFFKKKTKVDAQTAISVAKRAAGPRAEYDALKDDPHREPINIRTELTQTEQMFSAEKRVKAYVQSSNLYDNDNVGSTLDTAIRLTIGAKGGIPQFIDDGSTQAQKIFNAWKRQAGSFAQGNKPLFWRQEMLRQIRRQGGTGTGTK